ncbi:MAG TPA: DUF4396 domain-containing protein [Nevskiaceae bacterium]|nr:DUF4396 domain-containing protein [Nevskiaceae bacterium]
MSCSSTASTCPHHPPATAAATAAAPADAHAHHRQPAQPAHHTHHAHHAHHGPGAGGSRWSLTTAATLHCLSGCAIGEFVGLAIGVSLGLDPWTTMALATVLGFASGYTLGLWPLVRQGQSWRQAFRTLWLGETISIGVMEFTMNLTDYHVGGVMAHSLLDPVFWLGFGAALVAGFVVAWPVNAWLLGRQIKKPCH